MSIIMRKMQQSDALGFMNILNYYVKNTFNAYPEHEMGLSRFDVLYEDFKDYPNVCLYDEEAGMLGGYSYMHPYGKFSCFDHMALITHFIHPDYTGKGYGSKMLEHNINDAKERGLKVIFASISSLNEGSLNFHKKNGFVKCGHFKKALQKNGTFFDMVWVQLEI